MKKIFKLFIFAFVLFGLSFVNAEAAEKLNVVFKNIDPTNVSKTHTKALVGTQSSNIKYSQFTGGGFKETVVDGYITYTFAGWYTEDGTAIGESYTYTDLNLKVLPQSSNSLVRLEKTSISGDTVEEATVNISARWNIKDETPKKECTVRIVLDEKSESGKTVNSGNGISKDITNTITEGDSWTHITQALSITQFDNGGITYKVDGWYDENGSAVSESMYYNNDKNRIRINYVCNSDESVTLKYTLKWKEYKAPIIIMNLVDKVGHGSSSATNSDAVASAYKKTFRTPKDVPSNYKYLYWDLEGTHYCTGENCSEPTEFTTTYGDYNTTTTYTANAWYQPGIRVNYYNEDKSAFKLGEWSFEDVQMINDTPTKPGYEFDGWVDKDGNKVTDKTFKAPEITTEPNKAKEINLYATYKRIMFDLKLNKFWIDLNPDLRKSVTLEVYKDNEETLVGSYTLTADDVDEEIINKWSTTVSLPRYEEDGTLINYTVKEIEVEYYTSETTTTEDNTEVSVTNTIKNSTVTVNHVDEEDGTVLETETITNPIGSSYETSSTTIPDYEYIGEHEGEEKGVIAPEGINVTYFYRVLRGMITVYYVDIDTMDVMETATFVGKYNTAWPNIYKDFDEYEFVDSDGPMEGTFGSDEDVIKLFYTKNTGDEGEKEDNKEEEKQESKEQKEEDIITPPHTDADCEISIDLNNQVIYLDDRKYKNKKDFK